MSNSKTIITNLLTSFIIIIILLNLFVLNITHKVEIMGFCLILLGIYLFLFRYKKVQTLNRKQVFTIMILFGIIQIGLWYALGLLFSFIRNSSIINFRTIITIIIPYIISISCIEIIRYISISKIKSDGLFATLITLLFILIDVMLMNPNINFSNLNDFLEFIGFTLFPSIVYNIVSNKLIDKYGYMPNIGYRSVLIISYYMIPIVPNIYGLFRAIGKILIPFIMYFVIEYMYGKKTFEPVYIVKEKKFKIGTAIACILIAIFGALISLRFTYGVLIVGSGSMTGAVNYGDAVVLKTVSPDEVKIGDVIVYERGGIYIVHRVVEIGVFNNEYIFTTKGDKNPDNDSGYVYKENLKGKVECVVKYVGLPTLWLRDLFK